MNKILVFVGGGHAHLTSLSKTRYFVKKGIDVILISPSPYQYYSGLGPGMLGGYFKPEEIRFNVKSIVEKGGGSFIKDFVEKIDPEKKTLFLKSGREINYTIVSFGIGSIINVPFQISNDSKLIKVKPISNLFSFKEEFLKKYDNINSNIAIIGGGAAGVEIAGNLEKLISIIKNKPKIRLITKSKISEQFHHKTRDIIYHNFSNRGIEIYEDTNVEKVENQDIFHKDGVINRNNYIFLATGVKSSSVFRDSKLKTGKKDELLVNSYLQSLEYPEIFGGGDCISINGYDLAKVGVYAVRQNKILYLNIKSALFGGRMKKFKPQKVFLLILNLGDGNAILIRKLFLSYNRMNFRLKSYIDLKFMKKFKKFE